MVSVGTGIVFVALVAIWLAYFVQYWSRRREHLATARSVEDFAEAMRVLERRPTPRPAAGDRASTAYSVSPARVVAQQAPRPQVIAKPRPAPATPGGDPGMRPSTSPIEPPRQRAPRSAGPGPGRKIRGLGLLTALLATLVLTGLAAFSIVAWWAPLIGVGAVVATFVWLRSAVQAEIRARRAARTRVRRSRSTVTPASGAASAPGTEVEAQEHEVADLAVGRELIDDTTVVAADAGVTARGDGWQPVPVPPPTYTLKARAPGPAAAVAEDDIPGDDIPEANFTAPQSDPAADEAERRAAYGT